MERNAKDVFEAPVILYLVAGRTGSGKSTIAEGMCKEFDLKQIKSYTTRLMRAGEEKNADHIFIRHEDIPLYSDDIAAYTKIGEYEYFTTWNMLFNANNHVYVIDPTGIEFLQNEVARKGIADRFDFRIVYVTSDNAEENLKKRGDADDVAIKRKAAEDAQFTEFENKLKEGAMPDVIVLDNSGTVEEAIEKLRFEL